MIHDSLLFLIDRSPNPPLDFPHSHRREAFATVKVLEGVVSTALHQADADLRAAREALEQERTEVAHARYRQEREVEAAREAGELALTRARVEVARAGEIALRQTKSEIKARVDGIESQQLLEILCGELKEADCSLVVHRRMYREAQASIRKMNVKAKEEGIESQQLHEELTDADCSLVMAIKELEQERLQHQLLLLDIQSKPPLGAASWPRGPTSDFFDSQERPAF